MFSFPLVRYNKKVRQPEPSHLKTQTPIVAKQNYICSNSGNHLLNTPSYMEFAFLQKPQRKYVSVGVRLYRNPGILQKRKNTPITAYIKFCLAFIIVACFRENCNSFFEKSYYSAVLESERKKNACTQERCHVCKRTQS